MFRADSKPMFGNLRSRAIQTAPPAGKQQPNDMVRILESRLSIGQGDSIDELLAFEGIESCTENCDKKGLKAMREHHDAHEVEKAGFAKELHELRAQANTSTRNAGGGKKPPPAYEGKRFPKALPPPPPSEILDKGEFNSLLPPGIRVVPERIHGRWRMFWSSQTKSRSASWDLYGHEGCVRLLLREAWCDWTARTGQACPIAGVVPS